MAAWKAPSFDGGAEITNYRVLINSAHEVECVDVTETSCKFDQSLLLAAPFNLQWGSPFRVQVQAINAVGASPSSALATWTFNSKLVMFGVLVRAPDAPVKLNVDSKLNTESSLTLSFEDGFNGGSQITSYTVFWDTGSGPEVYKTGHEERTIKVEGVEKGTTYQFTVTAVNNFGSSAPSEAFEFFFDPILAPSNTFNLKEVVDLTSATQITLSWEEPLDNGGAEITEYRLFYG